MRVLKPGGKNFETELGLKKFQTHIKIKKMYVIAVYDVAAERTVKMLKLCRRYLHWIQNSVFEGEITEVKLKELIFEAKQIMDEDYDSFMIFKNRHKNWLEKEIIGKEKSQIDQFL